jgi:hypothetical protein
MMPNRLSYTVLKRRRLGREGVAFLRRVLDRISEAHCTKVPETFNPRLGCINPMGYVPNWDHTDNLQAFGIILSLKSQVEWQECYATTVEGV